MDKTLLRRLDRLEESAPPSGPPTIHRINFVDGAGNVSGSMTYEVPATRPAPKKRFSGRGRSDRGY
jgi:hypothetical protein